MSGTWDLQFTAFNCIGGSGFQEHTTMTVTQDGCGFFGAGPEPSPFALRITGTIDANGISSFNFVIPPLCNGGGSGVGTLVGDTFTGSIPHGETTCCGPDFAGDLRMTRIRA
jgi:hypothetical protein